MILASASSIRKKILTQVGLEFDVIPSGLDEDVFFSKNSDMISCTTLAICLAKEKCLTVSKKKKGRIILGADQILCHDQVVLQKPATMDMARKRLERLRNSAHVLYSAAALCQDGNIIWEHVDSCLLVMRNFSDNVLEEYLAYGGRRLLNSSGAYQLEDRGINLFEHIEGDYFVALGLPLLPLLVALQTLKVLEK